MSFEFGALESLAVAEALRYSRWGYALVNAAHIFGICLLVGGAVPMALRLLGLWSDTRRGDLIRVLTFTTGAGLGIAVTTGFLLFTTRAGEYANHPAFQLKLLFVFLGIASAMFAHFRYGRTLDSASRLTVIRIGSISIVCWIAALLAGRLIAFIE